MALDTRNKRASALAVRLPFLVSLGLPAPDGAITQADRQQTVQMYGGVLAVSLATRYGVYARVSISPRLGAESFAIRRT